MNDVRPAGRTDVLNWENISSVDSSYAGHWGSLLPEEISVFEKSETGGYSENLLSGHESFQHLLTHERTYWPFYSAHKEAGSFIVKAIVVEEQVESFIVIAEPELEPNQDGKETFFVADVRDIRPNVEAVQSIGRQVRPTLSDVVLSRPSGYSHVVQEPVVYAEAIIADVVSEPTYEYESTVVEVVDMHVEPILSADEVEVSGVSEEQENGSVQLPTADISETRRSFFSICADKISSGKEKRALIRAEKEAEHEEYLEFLASLQPAPATENQPTVLDEVSYVSAVEPEYVQETETIAIAVVESEPEPESVNFFIREPIAESRTAFESDLFQQENIVEETAFSDPIVLSRLSSISEEEVPLQDAPVLEMPVESRISMPFHSFFQSLKGAPMQDRECDVSREDEPDQALVSEQEEWKPFLPEADALSSTFLGSSFFQHEKITDTDVPMEYTPVIGSEPEIEETVSREKNTFISERRERVGSFLAHVSSTVSASFDTIMAVPQMRYVSVMAVFIIVLGGGVLAVNRIVSIKGEVLGASVEGASFATKAVDNLQTADFSSSSRNFIDAYQTFSDASDSLGTVGNELAKATRFVPWLSKVSSAQGLLEGAKYLSAAGVSMSSMLEVLPSSGIGNDKGDDISFLDMIDEAEKRSSVAADEIAAAQNAFDRVHPEDVPDDKREAFLSIRAKLPVVAAALGGFNRNSHLIREMLGENGPRMYLFLFQNNAELRPTGGFIGSYGVLDVSEGHIRKFFVDGIFNPDGQLKENIVPPAPIQKVSTAWSLHDSNWWPDFPTSAEKAIYFYEKTGGPTVDGVITLTPTVIQKLLHLTGPIDMPDYGVTIDENNFTQVAQEEVELKYDRKLNQPKKILSDLAPLLLERLFSMKSATLLSSLAETFSQALDEKHILLYSRNADVEKLVDEAGWSGKVLDTPRDYLSVIHTNLNGYKTDAVVKETIEHTAAVQADGSVLDTVRVTRKHSGGNSQYDWFNKVNTDYLRVYVPQGAELVSASGQTYEFPKSPINYDALGFKRDANVQKEEKSTIVDKGGTRISEESGKTVFGNWVYVSPGESVTVEYTYRLPFRVSPQVANPASYSVLFQKQSGSAGSTLHSRLTFPESFRTDWQSEGLNRDRNGFSFDATLATDAYYGTVLSSQ